MNGLIDRCVRFLKDWTLPVAMSAGVIGCLILMWVPELHGLRPVAKSVGSTLTPWLIFFQLLLTFCKVDPKELVPRKWHWIILAFQLLTSSGIAALIICLPLIQSERLILEGAMVCLICPTATAAAVVTAKLGGSASTLTTYTLLSNLLAAIVVPLMFPLVEPKESLGFWNAFLIILSKVLPLLIAPFVVAMLMRWMMKPIHHLLAENSHLAFYLWGVGLCIVMGQATHSLIVSSAPLATILMLSLAGLVTCAVQFAFGKWLGGRYRDVISAGQALGQKNTILAIWMAVTYLSPACSLAPGSYVIWQNAFNSWQLARKRKPINNI